MTNTIGRASVSPKQSIPPEGGFLGNGEVKAEKISFDHLLEHHLGNFGRYQLIQLILVCLPSVFLAMHVMSWTFAAVPSTITCENFATMENCTSSRYSAVDRWGIDGEHAWIKGTVQSFYYVGHMMGSLLWGVLSDRIGRKRVFCLAIVVEVVFGVLLITAPTWWLFAIFKFGTGFSHPGLYAVAIVIGTEIIGGGHRRIVAVTGAAFGVTGELILVGLAYFITDYRVLQAAIALPSVLLLSYFWLLPESPRWLASKERYEEANVTLRKAARINGSNIPDRWWEQLEKNQTGRPASHSLLDLFRTPKLRVRTLVCFLIWPVNAMMFYGLTMKSDIGGGSLYVNFALSAAVEVPAFLLVYFFIDRIGRRWMIVCSFSIAGICLIVNLFVSDHVEFYWGMLQIMVSKSAVTVAFTALYTYTSELFPTVIRNTAVGSCSTMARLGAVISSFIALWLVDRHGKLSMVIPFAVLSLASAILTALFLPETVNKPMCETISEVEDSKI